MTAATAEPAITDRTKALLPVHLFGNPGAGQASCWSWPPRGDQGPGGRRPGSRRQARRPHGGRARRRGHLQLLPLQEPRRLRRRRRRRHLRPRGRGDRAPVALPWLRGQRLHTEAGYNSRLDEIQAAGLRVLLPHMDEWTAARRAAAKGYADAGLGVHVAIQAETPGGESCWHLFVVRSPQRDRLAERLLPASRLAGSPGAPCPPLRGICAEILALPMGTALPGPGRRDGRGSGRWASRLGRFRHELR